MTDDGIRLIACTIDEDEDKNIVFRGVIDPGYLYLLKVDFAAGAIAGGYQREQAKPDVIARWADDLLNGARFPDLALGMRGQRYSERDGATWLHDPTYLIDGQQRCAAAARAMQVDPSFRPRLGATVYIGSTRAFEARQFKIWNTVKNKMPLGVYLIQGRANHEAINTLYLLTYDHNFALHGAVRWDQSREQRHLVSAMTYVKAAVVLHQHILGRHGININRTDDLLAALNHFGTSLSALRDNVRAFFEAIDEAWGIRDHTRKQRLLWLRENFLIAFAKVLSQNINFWTGDRGDRLKISTADIQKLSSFDFDQRNIVALAGGGSQARRSLILEIEGHLDSGRRTGRLIKRPNRLSLAVAVEPAA